MCFHVCAIDLSRHAAVVISGTELARQLHREIQRDVEELVAQGNMRPHLGVVLVGDDPASRTYVKNKTRAASILGKTWALPTFLYTECIVWLCLMHFTFLSMHGHIDIHA